VVPALLTTLLVLGPGSVAAADAFAPVGGSGFTAFRADSGEFEILTVDRFGAGRLARRGYEVALSVPMRRLELPVTVTGHPTSPPPVAPPTGVIVAVVDTGVSRTHPWFATHLLPGRNTIGVNPDDTDDRHGHGTHVAGIVRRADPTARILPVKVFDDSTWTTDAAIAAGVVWAVDNAARVINLSLGGEGDSAALRAALSYAVDRDVLVVAAAGNSGLEGSPPIYPAAYPETLAVTALNAASVVANFANRGAYIDLAARGAGVVSAALG